MTQPLMHLTQAAAFAALALTLGCARMPCADSSRVANQQPSYEAGLVFPLDAQHNHAPGIVECPNGDLMVSWYRGSGERKADDVAVLGARRRKGSSQWSEPFVLADTPGFPDGNTALHVDAKGRTWKWTRHLEHAASGSFHYRAVIQDRSGRIHCVYSYFVAGGKSMKHTVLNEAWVRRGDLGACLKKERGCVEDQPQAVWAIAWVGNSVPAAAGRGRHSRAPFSDRL